MSIDIGFLVCSNTTTKTYLQRAKHTFRSVLDSLCLGPRQEYHGLMSQGFSSLLFVLSSRLFPNPCSCISKLRFMLASIENTEHHAKQLSIAVWRDQNQWNKRRERFCAQESMVSQKQYHFCWNKGKARFEIKIYVYRPGFTCLHKYRINKTK